MLERTSVGGKGASNRPKNSDEAYELWVQLIYTVRALRKARKRELRKYNITPEQIGVLSGISHINSK